MNMLEPFAHRGQYTAKLCFKSYYCIYYPEQLIHGKIQCKTIIWANGTLAIPWIYDGLLRHLASWGYVVVASWSPFTMIDQVLLNGGIKMCQKLNTDDPLFKGLIDVNNLGVSGHSQGGGVAMLLARQDCIKASVAIEPAPVSCKKVKHPMLIIAGAFDVLAWPFLVFFISFLSTIKASYWLKHKRSGHLRPLGNAGIMRAPTCAFFEWHLHNNQNAKQCFEKPLESFPTEKHWEFKSRNVNT